MERVRFAGGSLSGTYLCRPTDAPPFVRKEVSLKFNREYGFQRWYSQLKRLQRYEILFPGTFPRLLSYGMDGELAHFDIEYIEHSTTAHEFLSRTTDKSAIDEFLRALLDTMNRMHDIKFPSTNGPIDLYIHEEIEQRIGACMSNDRFRSLVSHGEVYFNGEKVPGLVSVLDEYKKMSRHYYHHTTETFTHGNMTLENILYQPETKRVVFIDPYEENIIDSVLAEYSQIFQSSSSLYELYNVRTPKLTGNHIELRVEPSAGLAYFDTCFRKFVQGRHDAHDLTMIKLFEVSQYARMLPFKMQIDQDKMLFFYGLASYLFHLLREERTAS